MAGVTRFEFYIYIYILFTIRGSKTDDSLGYFGKGALEEAISGDVIKQKKSGHAWTFFLYCVLLRVYYKTTTRPRAKTVESKARKPIYIYKYLETIVKHFSYMFRIYSFSFCFVNDTP